MGDISTPAPAVEVNAENVQVDDSKTEAPAAQESKPETDVQSKTVDVVAKADYDDLVSRHKDTSNEAKTYRQKNSELNKTIETLTSEKESLAQEIYSLKRQNIVARYGITAEDAETFLISDDLEQIEKVAKALSERTAPKGNGAPTFVLPNEGKNTNKHLTSEEAARRKKADELFGI